jgi:uncharacterized membrane protein YiaA
LVYNGNWTLGHKGYIFGDLIRCNFSVHEKSDRENQNTLSVKHKLS